MGSVYKKSSLRPLQKNMELVEVRGKQVARWKNRQGKTLTLEVKRDDQGEIKVVTMSATYTAKYRDENGKSVEVSTGCREESSARKVLGELERRVELILAGVMTREESQVAGNQQRDISKHIEDYLTSLQVAGKSARYLEDCQRLTEKLIQDLHWSKLGDITPEAMERWLNAKKSEGMGARTRNTYLVAVKTFLNWCVERGRLLVNPLDKVRQVETRTDVRKQRRALTEQELNKLLYVARWRPLAEYGRLTVSIPSRDTRKRANWTYQELTFDSLQVSIEKAKERLAKTPAKIVELDSLGLERQLIYKTLLSTGLRKGELAGIGWEHLQIDGDESWLELPAANEKNRKGSKNPASM